MRAQAVRDMSSFYSLLYAVKHIMHLISSFRVLKTITTFYVAKII